MGRGGVVCGGLDSVGLGCVGLCVMTTGSSELSRVKGHSNATTSAAIPAAPSHRNNSSMRRLRFLASSARGASLRMGEAGICSARREIEGFMAGAS